MSNKILLIRRTFPGFFPFRRRPPFATAFPIARLLPAAPVCLGCTALSLRDSPSFWSKSRSSSSDDISSRFLLLPVAPSDSCSARSYRVARSLVCVGGEIVRKVVKLRGDAPASDSYQPLSREQQVPRSSRGGVGRTAAYSQPSFHALASSTARLIRTSLKEIEYDGRWLKVMILTLPFHH